MNLYKRLPAFLLALTCLLASLPLSAAAAATGDINRDGIIDQHDSLLLFQYGAGLISRPCELSEGDMNGDGMMDMRDALLLFLDTSGDTDNEVVPGVTDESAFMKNFAVQNTHTGNIFRAGSRSELQLAVATVVKYEVGAEKYAEKSAEAWKAMAVAAYTFVSRFCLDGAVYGIWLASDLDLSNQNDRRIYDAVGEVLGIKIAKPNESLTKKAQLCEIFYSSCSSGTTCSSLAAWGYASLPHLQPVASPYDTDEWVRYYSGGSEELTSTMTIGFSELVSKVSAYLGQAVSYESSGDYAFYPIEKENDYWHLTNLYYMNGGVKKYVNGLQVRTAIGARSHAFTVLAQTGDTLTLQSKGYGHGVGLSAFGAIGYANDAGWSYARILKHYFSITPSTAWQLVGPKWV